MAPDAHVKLLDSTIEPVPYTVTSNVQCSGLENTDFCTWTYVVTPTLYEGDEEWLSYSLHFLNERGNNAYSTLVVDYQRPVDPVG